jgi:hypothetical protein
MWRGGYPRWFKALHGLLEPAAGHNLLPSGHGARVRGLCVELGKVVVENPRTALSLHRKENEKFAFGHVGVALELAVPG